MLKISNPSLTSELDLRKESSVKLSLIKLYLLNVMKTISLYFLAGYEVL